MAVKTKRISDAEMKKLSGKTWGEWFVELDDRGGVSRGRREIGNYINTTYKVDPNVIAMINVEYENEHGVVEKDGRPKGYMICATKTVGGPVAEAYSLFADAKGWNQWLTKGAKVAFEEGGSYSSGEGHKGEIKKIRENKAIKFTWEHSEHAPGTVVEVTFQPKSETKCVVMVAHDRIQTSADADLMRETWGSALDRLKSKVEA